MESEENNNDIIDGTDALLSMNCTACAKNNKRILAQKYCIDCQEYFCESCIDMHGNFALLVNHVMMDATQLLSGVEEIETANHRMLQIPTERCVKHPAKVVDMYCNTHDVVGCSVCFQPHFKGCEDVYYIPDIVETMVSQDSLLKTIEDITATKEKIEKLVDACVGASAELKKMKEICLETVKEFRREIDEIIDELENETVKAIEQRYTELDTRLNADVESINDKIGMITKKLSELKMKDNNKSTLFVCQNICKQIVASANELIKSIGKPSLKARIFFKGDYSMKSHLSRLTSLGVIRDQKTSFNTVTSVMEHDIAVEDDKDQCNIWGTCVTGDGHVMIADNANNKLKMLDKRTYKVVAVCPLLASPRSLCKVSDTEVATSLSNKGIRFVTTGEQLVRGKFLQLEHNCFGLAVTNGQMFISDGSQSIYVYDTEGKPLRTISQDSTGESIFTESRDITVSDDGSRIHVADSRKGLITLTPEGKVIWKYTGSELKGAYGVCTDGEGNLLATGILSHNVMQMSQNGDKITEIIKASEGIQNPISVCFDRTNSKVIVTKNGKFVYAFEFA